MNRWMMCLAGLLLTQTPVHCAPAKVVSMVADLDRSGSVDSVTVTFLRTDDGSEHFQIAIREAMYDGLGEGLDRAASIVDIDSTDSSLEIAIPESGPSDDYATSFFRYRDGQIQFMGVVSGTGLQPDGSGVIQTECRGAILCTWFYKCAYRWDEEAQILVEIPQAFKRMGVSATLIRDLALTAEPIHYKTAVILKAGTKVVIDLTDDRHWCRVRTEDGVARWFSVDGDHLRPGFEPAMETFDGLPNAD